MPQVRKVGLLKAVKSESFSAFLKLLEALSYLCGIATLIIIALQLSSDAHERRVTKSLDMIARYGSDPLASYRAEVRDFEYANRREMDVIERNGGLSQADIAIWAGGRIREYQDKYPDRKVEAAIREIASFFDEVATCEDRNICDVETTRDFLNAEARDITCTYGAIVAEQARIFNRPQLGIGMRQVAGKTPCAKL